MPTPKKTADTETAKTKHSPHAEHVATLADIRGEAHFGAVSGDPATARNSRVFLTIATVLETLLTNIDPGAYDKASAALEELPDHGEPARKGD